MAKLVSWSRKCRYAGVNAIERLRLQERRFEGRKVVSMATRAKRVETALLIPNVHYWQLRMSQVTPVEI